MDGGPVYLSGKPQPTLSNVHEGELVHRVGHRAGRLDVSVCPYSELITGHLTPGFIVTLLRHSPERRARLASQSAFRQGVPSVVPIGFTVRSQQ